MALVVAAGLRIPGLFTDFWGDEIWSWWIAGHVHSIAGVVLSETSHIDNNHPLNTLWLYLVGQNQPVWLYRLPALLAGIGSVALAAKIMLRFGKLEAAFATLLFTFSYPLIFYSSEARGYSFVIFFSLLSLELLQDCLSEPAQKTGVKEILFGICTVLGFLSHLMFINAYTAAIVWSWVRVRQLESTTGKRLARLARLHAIPVIGVFLIFHFFVRELVDGGAPPTSSAAVLLQSLSLAVGGVKAGLDADLVAAITVGLFVSALIYLRRDRSSIAVFFLVAVVIAPALMCTRALVFTARPQPLMLRYFLISIAIFLESLCPLLAFIWRRSTVGCWMMALCVGIYVTGNMHNLADFLSVGRGHYADALAQIVAGSSDKTIVLSSDNPVRTQLLLNFYSPRVAPDRQISVDADPHQWLVFNRFDSNARPELEYRNRTYVLIRSWPSVDLSGWVWQVYHRKS